MPLENAHTHVPEVEHTILTPQGGQPNFGANIDEDNISNTVLSTYALPGLVSSAENNATVLPAPKCPFLLVRTLVGPSSQATVNLSQSAD